MRAALLSTLLAVAASGSAQTVLLRFHPPVGKTASYTVTTTMSMTLPAGAAAAAKPMRFTETIPMSLRVVSRTADTTTIETRTGPIKIGGTAGNPMAQNPALAKPSVIRMTLDELATPKGASGTGPTAAAVSGMTSAMGGGGATVALPRKPVKVGDTWTTRLDLGKIVGAAMRGAQGGGTGIKTNGQIPVTYRLVALKGGVATIGMVAHGTMSIDVAGHAMTSTMDIRSTALIDVATDSRAARPPRRTRPPRCRAWARCAST